jgi:hypothetical protein
MMTISAELKRKLKLLQQVLGPARRRARLITHLGSRSRLMVNNSSADR